MKKMREVRGIVPVLLTPVNREGDIDTQALRRLVKFLVDQPIGGLWVLGTGSEDMNLTFSKRLQVLETVCDAAKGRCPLIAGASFFAMEDSLEFIRETSFMNFDAYHVMPYHPLLGLERMEWYYRELADACPKPLWMYTSGNWCRHFPPEFVAGLKDHPNIAGIKFSTKNAVDMLKVLELREEGFQVITAVASQLYACLAMGSVAHTSSTASCLPELMIEIYDLFMRNEKSEALEKQYMFNHVMERFPSRPRQQNFLLAAVEKYVLKLRGICSEYTTSYYTELLNDEKKVVEEVFNNLSLVP